MLSILLTIAVWLGIHICLIDIAWLVPYDSNLVSIETADGKVYAKFHRDSYAGISAINPYTVEINGEEKNIVVFYYEDNLWAKHIEPLYMDKENNDTMFYLGNVDEIDEIYYCEFPGTEIYEKLPAFLEDKEIVWNK